jgi:hypothetical protein
MYIMRRPEISVPKRVILYLYLFGTIQCPLLPIDVAQPHLTAHFTTVLRFHAHQSLLSQPDVGHQVRLSSTWQYMLFSFSISLLILHSRSKDPQNMIRPVQGRRTKDGRDQRLSSLTPTGLRRIYERQEQSIYSSHPSSRYQIHTSSKNLSFLCSNLTMSHAVNTSASAFNIVRHVTNLSAPSKSHVSEAKRYVSGAFIRGERSTRQGTLPTTPSHYDAQKNFEFVSQLRRNSHSSIRWLWRATVTK